LTGPTDDQLWSIGRTRLFPSFDYDQTFTVYELIVKSTGQCLDIASKKGLGNVITRDCEDVIDQYFFFKNPGKMIHSGKIMNKKSNNCLNLFNLMWTEMFGSYAEIGSCDDEWAHHWKFYENGEIVN
jgi:hypothetical protein